jgi:hypothetical protein
MLQTLTSLASLFSLISLFLHHGLLGSRFVRHDDCKIPQKTHSYRLTPRCLASQYGWCWSFLFYSSLSILVAFGYSAVGTLMVAMDGSYRIPSISFILSRLCALWYVKPV